MDTPEMKALFLMKQATFMLYPVRGISQLSPGEWIEVADRLIRDTGAMRSLGRLGYDLMRRRENIIEKFHEEIRAEEPV